MIELPYCCRFRDHIKFDFEEARGEEGKRVYNEITDCDWFRDASAEVRKTVPEGHVLALVLSSDETLLHAKKSVHNMYLSLGLVDRQLRMKDFGRKVGDFLLGFAHLVQCGSRRSLG